MNHNGHHFEHPKDRDRPQARTTVIYTNWRRSSQLQKITEDCSRQSANPEILVVDNASDSRHRYEGIAHRIVRYTNERKCWQRWMEICYTNTQYILIMDDDLTFVDQDVISDCEQYMDENPAVQALGINGVCLLPGRSYWRSMHHPAGITDTKTDIIKGRFFFLRPDHITLMPRALDDFNDTCDDICVSAMLENKVIPAMLMSRITNLKEGLEALHASQDQRRKRDAAAAHYFSHA
jgi:hypothetical protein